MKAMTSHGPVGESGDRTLDTKLVQYNRSLGKRKIRMVLANQFITTKHTQRIHGTIVYLPTWVILMVFM